MARGGVLDGEVADVEFLDAGPAQRHRGGLAQRGPARGGEPGVGEVDDEAAGGVGGQGGGVRVGDRVGDGPAGVRRPDGDQVAVRLPGPGPVAPHAPHPARPVAVHRDAPAGQFEGDRAGGGRPDGEGGAAGVEHRSQGGPSGAGAVEVVEDAGELHAGGARPLGGALGGDQAPAQGGGGQGPVAGVDGEGRVAGQVGVGGALGGGEGAGGEADAAGGASGAVGRVAELQLCGDGLGALPDHGGAVDPLGLGLGPAAGRGRLGPGVRREGEHGGAGQQGEHGGGPTAEAVRGGGHGPWF